MKSINNYINESFFDNVKGSAFDYFKKELIKYDRKYRWSPGDEDNLHKIIEGFFTAMPKGSMIMYRIAARMPEISMIKSGDEEMSLLRPDGFVSMNVRYSILRSTEIFFTDINEFSDSVIKTLKFYK